MEIKCKQKNIIWEDLKKRAAVSPKEFSALTGISVPSVYRYLKSGDLHCKRFKGRILIPMMELQFHTEGGDDETAM